MLFKVAHLKAIKAGTISLAFRKWKKPQAKSGSIIKRAVGQLQLISVELFDEQNLTQQHAEKSGYLQLSELQKELNKREGNVYKIEFAYHSEDPRLALREQSDLSEAEFEVIKTKLARMDISSKNGAWTLAILHAIKENPKLRAADLAQQTGFEKDWLKPNIRKLKNLGLTISLEVGYRLSPRGIAVLEKLEK